MPPLILSESDSAPEGDVSQAPDPAPAQSQTPSPEADPRPTTEVDPFDAGADTFPREYVERLRQENASLRVASKPWRETFEGVDEDVQEYALSLVHNLLRDQPAFVQEAQELLKHLSPEEVVDAIEEATGENIEDLDRPLTRRELDKIEAERKAAAEEEAAIAGIHEELRGLGYAPGEEDVFGDTTAVIAMAVNHFKGDLKAAHQARIDRFNEAVEAALAQRLDDIRAGSAQWPPQSSGGASPPPSGSETPKTWADASARARARLSAQVGQ